MKIEPEDLHVIPINDWIEHPCAVSCACRPQIIDCLDGGRLIVHNSADGREHSEPEGSDGQDGLAN